MDGIIIVDKPAGWTSHDVVAKLRGTLKEKRVGHSGTLDPMATGVLVVFVGRATRAAGFCENSDKEYIAGLRLGLVTDTQDVTGSAISVCEACISAKDLSGVIPRFLGAQKQIPPMYSAIKLGGKKLYELARRGIEVQRPAKDVFISEIDLLEGEGDEYLLRVACSKGTYIRTLCNDIGAALGCGGSMSSLRRIKAGAFTIDMAHTIDEIKAYASSENIESLMLPVETIFSEYPAFSLGDADMRKCKNGAPCKAGNQHDGIYRFYGPDNKFIMLGEVCCGEIKVIKSFFLNEE